MGKETDPNRIQCPLPREEVLRLREHYRAALFEDCIPWWEKHSPDREQGGYYSCLERDGRVYCGDKFVWMLGRQVWMFSHLYACHEPRPEWLELARHGARFLLDHAFAPEGRPYFRLTRQGRPRAHGGNPYTECFIAIGLGELAAATGGEAMQGRAVDVYLRVRSLLGRPAPAPLLGYPLETPFCLHAHEMIRLTTAWVLNRLWPDPRWEDDLSRAAATIRDRYWRGEDRVLLENVGPDGSAMLEVPEGRMVHPGHAMESAWMLMELARRRGDEALMSLAADITAGSMERGWDETYGGVRYLVSLDGSPTWPVNADMKIWWVHAEALYATLLGWACTGREDLAAWFRRVHDYAFNHFPDPEHGEWYPYLNRDGSVVFTAKANGSKGCFHLPRMLFRVYQLLDRSVCFSSG